MDLAEEVREHSVLLSGMSRSCLGCSLLLGLLLLLQQEVLHRLLN